MWCIPPDGNAEFVCRMETVLGVYKRPIDHQRPVVCMDETTVQCVKEVRPGRQPRPGHSERYDAEYQRNGVAHLLLFYAPFQNWRRITVDDNHRATTWAQGVRDLLETTYPDAERVTLVMDNLNTHTGASLYKSFAPELARSLLERLEIIYTPKHGSWLNLAECEFSVLARQCLDRRLADIDTVRIEVDAWTHNRNSSTKPVDWRFTTADARIKLKRLYPNFEC